MLNVKKADEIEALMQAIFPDEKMTRRGIPTTGNGGSIRLNTRTELDRDKLRELVWVAESRPVLLLIKRSGAGLVIISS